MPPPQPPVEASLFFKLVRVVNLTARPFVEGIGRDERLALSEWRVMVVLAAHPGCPAQEVVARTALDKMTVSRALAGLARHRYVVRRADTADKRRTQLRLSAAGLRAYERIAVSGRAREAQLFSGISAAEQARLARTLDKLAANLSDDAGRELAAGAASLRSPAEPAGGRSPAEQAGVRSRRRPRLAALGPEEDERTER